MSAMWFENLSNPKTDMIHIALSVKSVISDVKSLGASKFNEQLEKIDVSKCNPHYLLTILRVTFSFRKKLARWAQLEKDTRALMIAKGGDLKLMKGLDKPY